MTDPLIDLLVLDTHNTKTLALADASVYPAGFVPVTPTLELTLPGLAPMVMAFTPGALGIYNSVSLGIDCASGCDTTPLPDGMYKAKVSFAPAQTRHRTFYFLRMDALKATFDLAWLKVDFTGCDVALKEDFHRQLLQIEDDLEGARIAAGVQDSRLATFLYNKATAALAAFNHLHA